MIKLSILSAILMAASLTGVNACPVHKEASKAAPKQEDECILQYSANTEGVEDFLGSPTRPIPRGN